MPEDAGRLEKEVSGQTARGLCRKRAKRQKKKKKNSYCTVHTLFCVQLHALVLSPSFIASKTPKPNALTSHQNVFACIMGTCRLRYPGRFCTCPLSFVFALRLESRRLKTPSPTLFCDKKKMEETLHDLCALVELLVVSGCCIFLNFFSDKLDSLLIVCRRRRRLGPRRPGGVATLVPSSRWAGKCLSIPLSVWRDVPYPIQCVQLYPPFFDLCLSMPSIGCSVLATEARRSSCGRVSHIPGIFVPVHPQLSQGIEYLYVYSVHTQIETCMRKGEYCDSNSP